jgi:hypothetical protein
MKRFSAETVRSFVFFPAAPAAAAQGICIGMDPMEDDLSDTKQRAAEPCLALGNTNRDVRTALPNAKRGRNRLEDTRKDSNVSAASYASTEPDWCQIPYDGNDVVAGQLRSHAVAESAAVGGKLPQRPLSPPSLRSSTSPSRAGTSARRLENSPQKASNLQQELHEGGRADSAGDAQPTSSR